VCNQVVDLVQCQANVLVNEEGHAVLTGFSRAGVIGKEGYSSSLLAGSSAYMAPELLSQTDADVDDLFSKKSDVYAFGMLCFKLRFQAKPCRTYEIITSPPRYSPTKSHSRATMLVWIGKSCP